MSSAIDKMVNELASRDYRTRIAKEKLTSGDEVFVAYHPELPGCMAQGPSLSEALESLEAAREDYIRTLLEDEMPVPVPSQSLTSSSSSASGLSEAGTIRIPWTQFERGDDDEFSNESIGEFVFEGAPKS